MTIEKQLAEKVFYSIHIEDKVNVEKFYRGYLEYIQIINSSNYELKSRVINAYAKYKKREVEEEGFPFPLEQ